MTASGLPSRSPSLPSRGHGLVGDGRHAIEEEVEPALPVAFDTDCVKVHIPQRSETTVPQQSLFLMNHPIALERARILAAAGADEPTATAGVDHRTDEVRWLFRRVFQRDPTVEQLDDALQLLASDVPDTEQPPRTASDWSYGSGTFDETSQRVPEFSPLPHFTGTAWQGGTAWPDAKLGWVQLTATGGHPGDDRQHASVRRWTAPAGMTLTIRSEVHHEPEAGDGIRAFIVSSRTGLLQSSKVHHQTATLNVDSLIVEPGETIDFVVDIGDVLNSDQHFWRCTLTSTTSTDPATTWNSETDFPRSEIERLTPLEQLAQVLLCSNEFMFVD